MKNKYLLLATGALVLGIGIWFSYYNFHKIIPTKEIKDSPFSILMQNATDTFAESTDWYEAKIEYPKNNQKIRDQVFSMWEDFAKENELKKYNNLAEAKEGLQINVDGLKYGFFANYSLATSSNTISYIYEIYNFTGGAHGSTTVIPITLDANLNTIPINKILPDEKLEKISKLALADLKKQRVQRLKDANMSESDIKSMLSNDTWMEEGTKPTRENYNSVWFDGDNLVISFGQYQVASYAEGIFTVKIPLSELNN